MITKLEDLNEYGKRVEDIGIALQKLAAAGKRHEAMAIRLVTYHHLRHLIDMLRRHSLVTGWEVYAATAAILNGQRAEEKAAEKPERVPVVILGQGSSERRYYEEDFATRPSKAGPGAWARLRAFFGGSNNG